MQIPPDVFGAARLDTPSKKLFRALSEEIFAGLFEQEYNGRVPQ
jgi:hypothetical protein